MATGEKLVNVVMESKDPTTFIKIVFKQLSNEKTNEWRLTMSYTDIENFFSKLISFVVNVIK